LVDLKKIFEGENRKKPALHRTGPEIARFVVKRKITGEEQHPVGKKKAFPKKSRTRKKANFGQKEEEKKYLKKNLDGGKGNVLGGKKERMW